MDIQGAILALQQGHKIKRDWWSKGCYLTLSDSRQSILRVLKNHEPKLYAFIPADIQATDWVKIGLKEYILNKWVKSTVFPQDIYTKELAEQKLRDLNTLYPSSEIRFEMEEVKE